MKPPVAEFMNVPQIGVDWELYGSSTGKAHLARAPKSLGKLSKKKFRIRKRMRVRTSCWQRCHRLRTGSVLGIYKFEFTPLHPYEVRINSQCAEWTRNRRRQGSKAYPYIDFFRFISNLSNDRLKSQDPNGYFWHEAFVLFSRSHQPCHLMDNHHHIVRP